MDAQHTPEYRWGYTAFMENSASPQNNPYHETRDARRFGQWLNGLRAAEREVEEQCGAIAKATS